MSAPLLLAHRGDMESGPENTMTALRAAVQKGADGVEIDIRRTKDGQAVVFHDDRLGRVAPQAAALFQDDCIEALTLEELSHVHLPFAGHLLKAFPKEGWPDERMCFQPENLTGAGDARTEHILPLRDCFDWLSVQAPSFFAEVEVKSKGVIGEAMRLSELCGVQKQVIFFSGEQEINREIQCFCKENGLPDGVRIGANIRFVREDTLREIQDYNLYEVGLNADAFEEEDVRLFASRGIRVFSNLGDTPQWWAKMRTMDVAAFKCNSTDGYRSWERNRREQKY